LSHGVNSHRGVGASAGAVSPSAEFFNSGNGG
jgi:hypothetical protein